MSSLKDQFILTLCLIELLKSHNLTRINWKENKEIDLILNEKF